MIKEIVALMYNPLNNDIKLMFPGIKDYSVEYVLLEQIKNSCELLQGMGE